MLRKKTDTRNGSAGIWLQYSKALCDAYHFTKNHENTKLVQEIKHFARWIVWGKMYRYFCLFYIDSEITQKLGYYLLEEKVAFIPPNQ